MMKYQAHITTNGKQKLIGSFATEIEAFNCYKAKKEAECRRVAERYRDVIPTPVYDALLRYEVSWDD